MTDANTYHITYKWNKTQVFVISISDLEFQAIKKVKQETDLKSFVLEEYNDFLNLFSKKILDTLLSNQKYDYKILLEEEQKYGYAFYIKCHLKNMI